MTYELIGGNGRYIGDGVYASFDGWHIWLQTMEGNKIALDAHVMGALAAYAKDLRESILQPPQAEPEQPA